MFDRINPKNIIKYLDMRGIPHRDALEVNIKPINVHKLPQRHSCQYGNAIRNLNKLEKRNSKKMERVASLVEAYGGKIRVNE